MFFSSYGFEQYLYIRLGFYKDIVEFLGVEMNRGFSVGFSVLLLGFESVPLFE